MANSKEAVQKEIDQWVATSNSVCIVLFGKIGAGKSSLVNTLFKKQLAKEGGRLYSETKVVHCHSKLRRIRITFRQTQFVQNGVRVTLWDTPGLKDPFAELSDSELLKDIDEKCDIHNGVDLLVFCMCFNHKRLEDGDVDCIRAVTNVFGDKIWNKALFAFTFANQASPSDSANIKKRGEEWKEILDRSMKDIVKVDIKDSEIRSIPVIPTGYGTENLPEGWLTEFWRACLSQVNFFNIPALYLSTGDQIQIEVEPDDTAEVLGLRLAKIGDNVQQELEVARRTKTDSGVQDMQPRVVAPPHIWSNTLVETLQQRLQKLNLDVGTHKAPVPPTK